MSRFLPPREEPYVAQCKCTHEDRFDGRTVKHFRFFPYPPKSCPAHPTPEGWFR